jgi:acetoin utilization deacetylase AcuC-like enzyme
VEAVHAGRLIDHLRTAYAASRANTPAGEPFIPDTFAVHARRPTAARFPATAGALAFDVSCPIFEHTWDASYWATQSAVTAAELVRTGGRAAYALVRPPGHHAGPDFHGGFCYTTHAAAAARYLQQADSCRVAVLDIDYHHGNGTQEIFYRDPAVLFCSLHADPAQDYPYFWGHADERGDGPGEGFTHNRPLPVGTGDGEYEAALGEVLNVVRGFRPAYLVLSAGFDLMAGDPVPRDGGFPITAAGLRAVGEQIAALGLPAVIVQEGGYNLARLGEYAVTLLRAFGGG